MPVTTRIRNVPSVSVPRYHVALKRHHPLANLGREEVQKDILLNGQRTVQRAVCPCHCETWIATRGWRGLLSIINSAS